MFYEPAMILAMVLFYLDVRVRKEALDLEWGAHQTQPVEAALSGDAMAPASFPTQSAFPTPAEPINAPPSGFPVAPTNIAPTDAPAVAWQSLVEESPPPPPPINAPLPGDVATLACPKCGAVSPATSTFCMTCGALLKSDA